MIKEEETKISNKSKNSLIGYENITEDGGVKKKIVKFGFGGNPVDGEELTVNFIATLEDGRTLDNTYITREPFVFCLGKKSVIPGLELALKRMKMSEHALVVIQPEYSFLEFEISKLENEKKEEFELKKSKKYSEDELKEMDAKEARYYLPVTYDIELVKFDKHRKHKSVMQPEERIEEAGFLKIEGNELFRDKKFREAIIKYETGLNYLHQMPTENLNQKVLDLRLQFFLNITNCHLSLFEYNYALKKVEEAFTMKNPPPVKCYYYRCIALMNLGEFEKAGKDYKLLRTMLPNDIQIKQLENDFEKIKENSTKQKKGIIKKGIFGAKLYEEKEVAIKKLPCNEESSKCFYIDLLVNQNNKDPQKLKFEIFLHSMINLKSVFEEIDVIVRDKKLKNGEIVVNTQIYEVLSLFQFENSENDKFEEYFKKNVSTNIYPPCEKYLLVLLKQDKKYILSVTFDKISENLVENMIVLGRCYYNVDFLSKILTISKEEKEVKIEVTDCGYSLNIY